MNIYNVFVRNGILPAKENDLILVKNSFSFSAFIYGFLWFIPYKMWKHFFLIFILTIMVSTTLHLVFSENIALMGDLFFALLIAYNANHWLLEKLAKSKDYVFFGVVLEDSADRAQSKVINSIYRTSYKE